MSKTRLSLLPLHAQLFSGENITLSDSLVVSGKDSDFKPLYLFSDYSLCARHCSRHCGYNKEQNGPNSCSHGVHTPLPIKLKEKKKWGFPSGSVGKESACNVGDLGSIPGSGRFPWRRKWLPTAIELMCLLEHLKCVLPVFTDTGLLCRT